MLPSSTSERLDFAGSKTRGWPVSREEKPDLSMLPNDCVPISRDRNVTG
jgi:hypothetical protein